MAALTKNQAIYFNSGSLESLVTRSYVLWYVCLFPCLVVIHGQYLFGLV